MYTCCRVNIYWAVYTFSRKTDYATIANVVGCCVTPSGDTLVVVLGTRAHRKLTFQVISLHYSSTQPIANNVKVTAPNPWIKNIEVGQSLFLKFRFTNYISFCFRRQLWCNVCGPQDSVAGSNYRPSSPSRRDV